MSIRIGGGAGVLRSFANHYEIHAKVLGISVSSSHRVPGSARAQNSSASLISDFPAAGVLLRAEHAVRTPERPF